MTLLLAVWLYLVAGMTFGVLSYVLLLKAVRAPIDELGRPQELRAILAGTSIQEALVALAAWPLLVVADIVYALAGLSRGAWLRLAGGAPDPIGHVVAVVTTVDRTIIAIDGVVVSDSFKADEAVQALHFVANRIEGMGFHPEPEGVPQ